MKASTYAVLLLALSLGVVAVVVNSEAVLADSCTGQLGYPIVPTIYSYTNVPIVVPVSATCSTYYSSQLYATGSALDVTSNIGVGSASTFLQPVSGGTIFNGQLGFNLPPSVQGHSVQISVSIYNSQYGSLITTSSEIIQVSSGTQQITTTTTTQTANYPYLSPAFLYMNRQNQRQYQNQSQNTNNTSIFGYVAIAAILAAVIIATAGLVVYGRRQTN